MATVHILALSSGEPTPNDRPKVPNIEDIEELAKNIEGIASVLSDLLENERAWRKGLSPKDQKLLANNVQQFRALCEPHTKELLQQFSDFSGLFSSLFGSLYSSHSHTQIENFAGPLESRASKIAAQIASMHANKIWEFTSNFTKLVRDVAPNSYAQFGRYSTELQGVFERLEAFWRVVANYLSGVLERRSEAPPSDTSLEAERRWSQYTVILAKTSFQLTRSRDALGAIAPKNAPDKPSGFFQVFRRLFRRSGAKQ